MKRTYRILVALVTVSFLAITIAHAEEEKEIALAKVPEKVLEAAKKAVPGITLTEAEVEKTRGGLVYEIEGTAEGKEYEIEISAEGKVLEIEQSADDEEDKDRDKS